LIVPVLLVCSCKCEDAPRISSFVFEELTPSATGSIDHSDGTIHINVPEGTDLSSLSPIVSVESPGCHSLQPKSNTSQDFRTPVYYTVTNEVGEDKTYSVAVSQENTNPETMKISWQEASPLPETLGWMPAVEVNNKIYVLGGGLDETRLTGRIYIYDPVDVTWEASESILPIPRFAHAASVLNSKIYVSGGAPAAESAALKDIQVYNPVTGSWEASIQMPVERAAHGSCVLEGKLYLVGGELEEPTGNSVIGDVSVYDPSSQTWTTKAPLNIPRAYLSVEALNGKIYAAGGTTGSPYEGENVLEEYDPQTNTWTLKSAMPFKRWGMGSCAINGHLIFTAGCPIPMNPGSPSVQVFSPADNTWLSGTNLLNLRIAPAVCNWQDQIYVFGGAISPAPWPDNTNSVEIGSPAWE